MPDGVDLYATESNSDSKIGIVIVPGITVPRESYYRLLSSLSRWNVLVFDLGGQVFSYGELNFNDCMSGFRGLS